VTTALRTLGLAVLVLITSAGVAGATPPSGYNCSPGTPSKGIGCQCPGGHANRRDDQDVAVCVKRAIKSLVVPKQQGYDALLAKANLLADTNCNAAEAEYIKALAAKPNGVEALVGSGNCMLETSKWTSAHSRFRSALSISPRYEGAMWGVAEAYRRQGKKDDAVAAYRQYLDAFPNSYKAKAALERLAPKAVAQPIPDAGGDPWNKSQFPQRTTDVVVNIDGTKIQLNGVELSGRPMVADVQAVLGKPDRVWDTSGGVNKIHTWDRLGVIVYEPKDGTPGRGISITFPFKAMGQTYTPSTNFAGSLSVDGKAVLATTILGSVKSRPGATAPYGADSVVFPKGDFNVFMNADEATDPVSLVELSLWKKVEATVPVVTSKFPARSAEIKVVVTGTKVVVNGIEISGKPMVADFEAVFGKPDRTWGTDTSVNKVHTWDRLGLLVYEPKDGRAISATFPYKPLGQSFDPATMFGGSIIVDGRSMAPSIDLATVKTRPGATQPYSAASVMFDKGDVHVFTTGKGVGQQLDLVEISFWQRDKAAPVLKTGKPTRTTDVRVTVNGTKVTINGVDISGKPMLTDLAAVLGKADRVWDQGSGNRIHTWDRLGIIVYEPRDGRCISTTFPYKAMGQSYDPSTLFGGSILVDGKPLTSTTDLATVKAQPGATTPYGADSIVFDKDDIHVFTLAKGAAKTLELVEVSYWQRDKK